MRNASFFTARTFKIETDLTDERHIIGFIDATVSALENEHENATAALLEAQRDAENLARTNQAWRAWQTLTGIHNEPPSLFDALDQNLRYRAFKLATHYWEGKWLLEMKDQLNEGYNENQSPSKQQRKWRRYAKLTPCFVSTLYMVPKFFSAFTGEVVPLIEFIDLLIIDEAGQVAPEVAGASFALAKKALVVGDTLQIEPVWSVTRKVDGGNLQKHELISTDDDIEQFNDAGMSAATGSAMRVAQRQSRFQKYSDDIARGMFLSEHQRCVPEIIDYCNALAYKGRLKPIRKRGVDYPLPRMGFAHIPGKSQSQGGSRSNLLEAEIIAQWITDQRSFLIDVLRSDPQKPNKTLAKIIAVITPFANQARLIDAELEKRSITDVTVGTTHALQGAARDVIIFSPVYDHSYKGEYFFDRGLNMLNVAVSRARKSFLVLGDMSVFDPKQKSPSGLLARYLFADEANEITNIQIETRATQSESLPFRRLSNNKEHEEEMIRCFSRVKHSLVIVSPWITAEVIEKHGVDRLVREASSRGVIVSIYVDEEYNKYHGSERPTARRGKELLRAAGAQVKVASPVHNKTLCMDDYLLIEGSFNWLSAQRDSSDKYYKENASLVYEGMEMGTEIKKIIGEMERRVVS